MTKELNMWHFTMPNLCTGFTTSESGYVRIDVAITDTKKNKFHKF